MQFYCLIYTTLAFEKGSLKCSHVIKMGNLKSYTAPGYFKIAHLKPIMKTYELQYLTSFELWFLVTEY